MDDERSGVDSDAGGSPLLVLASRLHTGQNVLHEVSQASTHRAWNSGEKIYNMRSLNRKEKSNEKINRSHTYCGDKVEL